MELVILGVRSLWNSLLTSNWRKYYTTPHYSIDQLAFYTTLTAFFTFNPSDMAFQFCKTKLPKQLFINNEFVDSKNTKKLTLRNPNDDSLIADDVPLADENDVDAAVAAAEKAFPAWRKLAPNARRDIMMKFASLIEKHGIALSELTRISLGAPYEAFGKFEAGLCAEVCPIFCISRTVPDQNYRPSNTTLAGSTNSPENPIPKKTAS